MSQTLILKPGLELLVSGIKIGGCFREDWRSYFKEISNELGNLTCQVRPKQCNAANYT